MMTAKEARENLEKIYTAMEGLYDFCRDSENYPKFKAPSESERKAITDLIYAFFEFDESGKITGLCESTVNLYSKIKEFKDIR